MRDDNPPALFSSLNILLAILMLLPVYITFYNFDWHCISTDQVGKN
jgi:hypothetical protein